MSPAGSKGGVIMPIKPEKEVEMASVAGSKGGVRKPPERPEEKKGEK